MRSVVQLYAEHAVRSNEDRCSGAIVLNINMTSGSCKDIFLIDASFDCTRQAIEAMLGGESEI